MSTDPASKPIRQRWTDPPGGSAGDPDAHEQRAAALLRALGSKQRDPRAVSRLLAELVARAEGAQRKAPRVAFVFRMALAGLLLVSFGGAFALVHRWEETRRAAQVVVPPATRPKHSAAPAPIQVPAPAPEPIAEPEPLQRPLSREARPSAPAPTIAAPAASAPVPTAAPADESLTVETSMLDKALSALAQRQPQDALTAIGAYRQQFPHGKLEYEADLAEVKSQIALGKDAPALAVLDRAIAIRGFDALPRSPDISLLRAELLARTGDCAGAVPAFSRLLQGEPPEPGLEERAVYGRAICLGKLGQRAQSRQALRDYLNRFPDGRFVGAAQDALDPLE